MPVTPIIPFDNSTGPTPTPTELLSSPQSFQPRGESKSDNLDTRDMSLNDLMATIPIVPTQNADNSNIYSPAKGTERYSAYNPQYNNEDEYGKNQGAVRQFFGGVTKGLLDLGVSFGQTLTFQPKAEWADNAKEYIDNVLLPNYHTEKQDNSNFNWVPFSGGAANFWGDKVVKNTLDMVGMIGATAVQAAAVEAVTAGIGEAFVLPEQMANMSLKLSKLLTGVDKSAEFLRDAGIEGEAFTNSYKAIKTAQGAKAFKAGVNSFVNTGTNFMFSHYMAAQGEHQVYKATKDELLSKYQQENNIEASGEDLAKIEKTANDVANTSYYTDLSLFMAQSMALPGLLRMFRPAGGIIKDATASMRDIEMAKAPKTLSDVDKVTAKLHKGGIVDNFLMPFAKNGSILGGITAATETGHEAIRKYFLDKYDGKAQGTVNDAIGDIGSGLAKTFGTVEGWSGILGSTLMGGLIGPLEHGVREFQLKKAGIDVNATTINALKGIDNFKSDILFKNRYQGAVDAAKAQSDLNEASTTNDPWKYKNAQKDGFFNFIMSGLVSNLHDVRKGQLDLIKQLPDAEIHSLFGEDKTSIIDKKQYIDKLIEKADRLKKSYDAIGELYPQRTRHFTNPKTEKEIASNKEYEKTQGYQTILTKMAFDKEEHTNNLKDIDLDNKKDHPLLTNNLLESLITKGGREALRKEYNEDIEYLNTQLHNKAGSTFHASALKEAREQRDELIKHEAALKQVQDMPNLDPIVYSKIFEQVLNFELNGRKANSLESLPKDRTVPLINRGVEILENKAAREAADQAYGQLFSSDGPSLYDDLTIKHKDVSGLVTPPDTIYKGEERVADVKKGLGIAENQDEYNKNKADDANDPFNATPESPRTFTLNPSAKPKQYRVSKETKSDGTNVYAVKDLRDVTVHTFPTMEAAVNSITDLNKSLVVPTNFTTSGFVNGDGTIAGTYNDGHTVTTVNLHPDMLKNYTATLTPDEVVNDDDHKEINWKIISATKSGAFKGFAAPPFMNFTPPDDVLQHYSFEGGMKKEHQYNLTSTTTPPSHEFADRHVKTAQHFLGNYDGIYRKFDNEKRGSLKVRLIHAGNEEALGLKGLIARANNTADAKDYDQSNPDERTILAVFVEQEGKKFHLLNAKGERIDGKNLEDVVYQTMPIPTEHRKNLSKKGEKVSRFRTTDTEEQIASNILKAKQLRDNVFGSVDEKTTPGFSFDVSAGFPLLEDKDLNSGLRPRFSAVGRIIDRDVLDASVGGKSPMDIGIGKAGITNTRGENIPVPEGTTWINHGSTLAPLSNRTLHANEVETITKLLENYIGAQEGTKALYGKTTDKERQTRQEHINSINEIVRHLQGTIYFSDKLHPLTSPSKAAEELAANNQMYFVEKGYVVIGKSRFPLTTETFKNADSVKKLKDALSLLYTNANNTLLRSNEPFVETYLKGGEPEQRTWKSYSHYLLSDRYDVTDKKDPLYGQARNVDEIPFQTSVKERPKNEENSNFDGKYVILNNVKEVKVSKPKEPTTPKQEPKAKAPEAKKESVVNIETPKKYSGLTGNGAPEIDADRIDWEGQGLDKDDILSAFGNIKKIVLIETRGLNAQGIPVGTIRVIGEHGVENFDVYFKKDRQLNEIKSDVPVNLKGQTREDYYAETHKDPSKIEALLEKINPSLYEAYKGFPEEDKVLTRETLAGQLFDREVKAVEQEKINPVSQTNQAEIEEITKTAEEAKEAIKTSPEAAEPGKVKRAPSNKPKSKYRLANELIYTPHDLAKSEAWLESNMPAGSAERVSNLLATTDGGYAFGAYMDGHIKFYENAKRGTVEHESFHMVFNSFASFKEQRNLLKEFRGRGEDTFVSHEDGRTIKYKDATDHEAEEEMAEEAQRFILDGKLYEKPKAQGNAIYRFFKSIVDFFKSWRKGNIQRLFEKMDSGYYKSATANRDFSGETKYNRLGNQTITDTLSITKGVTTMMMQHLFGGVEGDENNQTLVNFDTGGAEKKIDKLFEKAYKQVKEEFATEWEEGSDTNPSYGGVLDDFEEGKITKDQFQRLQELWKDIDANWDHKADETPEMKARMTVKDAVLNHIKSFGVRDPEEFAEFKPDNEFMKNAFQIDNNGAMSASMKLLFGTMQRKFWSDDEGFGRDVVNMIDPRTRMPIPIDVAITANFLREQMSRVNTLTEKMEVLQDLTHQDPAFETLINRLKVGDDSTPLTLDDMKLIANFNNVFSKQRPRANVHEVGPDYSITYAQNESSTKLRQSNSWIDSWKIMSDEDSLVKSDEKTGNYVFNGAAIAGYDVSRPETREVGNKKIPGALEFLNDLNIDFDQEMFDRLDGDDKKRFGEAVKGLAEYLPGAEIGVMESRKVGAAGRLQTIAELYLKAKGVTDSMFHNVEGKSQSQDVGKNYVNSINTDINNAKSKAEFLSLYPHFDQLYRKDGVYLNSVFFNDNTRTGTKTSTDYIQGINYRTQKEINTIGMMDHPERVMEEVNQNLAKNFYILVGADATTEWTIKMQHIIKYQDMLSGKGDKAFYDIFEGYYQTEKAIAEQRIAQGNKKKYESTIVQDGLAKDYSADHLDPKAVKEHLEARAKSLIEYLKKNGMIQEGTIDYQTSGWEVKNLDTDFLRGEAHNGNFSDEELLNLFKFTEANYAINNVEMFKLYYGDPADAGDWLKRVKSSLSPRESSIYGSPKFNENLNRLLNVSGDVQINPLNPRYRLHTDYFKTVTLADHYSFIENIVNDETLPEEIRKGFKLNNDTDGAGWVTVTGHREIMYKRGQVTNEHDKLYDYILAKDNQLMLEDGYLHAREGEWGYYSVEERARDKELLKKGHNGIKATYDAVKPIVFGVDENGKTTLHKYALAAGSYSQMRGGPMEKAYIQMLKDQIHYAVMESGVKIGMDGAHSVYNEDGTINDESFADNTRSKISFQWFGIQTEIGGSKHKQAFLSQASTDVFLNSYGEGKPMDYKGTVEEWHAIEDPQEKRNVSEKHALVQHHIDVLREMQTHAYEGLIKSLGIKEVEDGKGNFHYDIPDKSLLEAKLKEELLRRDVPQNLRDALSINKQTGQFNTPLEGIANYRQMKDILYSYVDKVICLPKQNGAPKVLQATLSAGTKDKLETRKVSTKKGDVTSYVSSDKDENVIKFYRRSDDKKSILPAEIVMTSDLPRKMRQHPRWRNATDEELIAYLKEKDKGILDVVGARIPTQEMNSLEAMTTKAFLPSYHGDAAIAAQGMTTKAGLDFDADKMNTYQKNVYMDKNGDIHQVPYLGMGEEAISKFREIAKQQFIDKHAEDEDFDEEDVIDHDFEDAANKLYKESLQNEYYSTMHKIILDPANYERLIRPNSADAGKKIAKDLEDMAPAEFSANSRGSLLSRAYMSQQRQYFLIGKKEISKLAMGQKMHSMYQLTRVFVDPERFGNVIDSERAFLGDGVLLLPHNKTTINGKEYSTISGVTDYRGKNFISGSFSQFIDGSVDIAKGAWLMDIIQHPLMTSKLATLIHFGCDEEQASMYLNQPIIREYIKMLAANNDTFLTKLSDSRERRDLLRMFPVGEADADEAVKTIYKVIEERKKEGFDPSVLPDRIKEYYKADADGLPVKNLSSFEKNIEQHMILQDFMKLCVLDRHMLDLQIGTTYDTKSSGDPNLQQRKQEATQRARKYNVFSSIDAILRATHMDNLANLTQLASEGIGEGAFKVADREVRSYIGKILRRFPTMAEDRFKRAAHSVEEGLISFMMQTHGADAINTRIHELLVDSKTNMAKRILDFRMGLPEDSDIANNMFLKELVVQTQNKADDVKNVFMSRKLNTGQTVDAYVSAIREFRDNPHVKAAGLYEDLLTTSFLQSGISNSPISMGKYIPSEDYGRRLGEVVDRLNDTEMLTKWIKSDDFFRGHWNDVHIVPQVLESYNVEKGTSTHRVTADQYAAFKAIKQSGAYPDYNDVTRERVRNHALVDKYTIEGDQIHFEGHPDVKASFKNGRFFDQFGNSYNKGETPEEIIQGGINALNKRSDAEKDARGLTRLAVPAKDEYQQEPYLGYMMFRLKSDKTAAQSDFVHFVAQELSNLQAIKRGDTNSFGATVEEKNTHYLLKRINKHKQEEDGTWIDTGIPEIFDGHHLYVPISPRGNGWNAEEHYADNSKGVLKNGYKVATEIPTAHIWSAMMQVQYDKETLRNTGKAVIPKPEPVKVNLVETPKSTTFVEPEKQPIDVIVKKDDASNWKLRVNPDGTVLRLTKENKFEALDEVKDKKLINKAQLKSGFLEYKLVEANNGIKYAVTKEGRVFTMAESNMGTELLADSGVKKQALEAYSKLTPEEISGQIDHQKYPTLAELEMSKEHEKIVEGNMPFAEEVAKYLINNEEISYEENPKEFIERMNALLHPEREITTSDLADIAVKRPDDEMTLAEFQAKATRLIDTANKGRDRFIQREIDRLIEDEYYEPETEKDHNEINNAKLDPATRIGYLEEAHSNWKKQLMDALKQCL